MLMREQYLSKIREFYDSKLIKILVGIRRCGKSTILRQIIDELRKNGISEDHISYINFENLAFNKLRTKENTVSIFTKIPGIAEKRARTLTKTFTTLENLVFAQTEQISQAINVSLDEAKSIQLEAKKLLKEQNLKKEQQKQSLKSYGTTPEAAAKAQRPEADRRSGSGTAIAPLRGHPQG